MKGVMVETIISIQKEIDTERNIQEKIKWDSEWFGSFEQIQVGRSSTIFEAFENDEEKITRQWSLLSRGRAKSSLLTFA